MLKLEGILVVPKGKYETWTRTWTESCILKWMLFQYTILLQVPPWLLWQVPSHTSRLTAVCFDIVFQCRTEYKIPGLYVIDSIVRQSRHQFGVDRDVFAPRFAKNLSTTFYHIFKCPAEDKASGVPEGYRLGAFFLGFHDFLLFYQIPPIELRSG